MKKIKILKTFDWKRINYTPRKKLKGDEFYPHELITLERDGFISVEEDTTPKKTSKAKADVIKD